VYCLTEKLDRKQLKVSKKYGQMYKGDAWGDGVLFKSANTPYNNNSSTWGGWEFNYPEIGDDPSPDWKYIYDLVQFVASSSNDDFIKNIGEKVDINNVIDYLIFINTVVAPDNTGKNCFISLYDYRNKSKFFFSVWDLDGSLGRNWDGSKYQDGFFFFEGTNNSLFNRLLVLNPDGFIQKLKSRWNYLKSNQLSKAKLSERLEFYRKQLTTTNAIERERKIWPNINQDLDTEVSYISRWYDLHLESLDSYINGL
jgi:spore coat protein CotH